VSAPERQTPDRWTIVSTAPFPADALRKFLPEGTEADIVVVEPRTEDAAVAAVADADIVIGDFTFTVPITRRVIEAMTRCRAILQPSAGFQQIDHTAAAEHGIPVCNCAGANDIPVAEHTVMAGIALMRELAWTDRQIRAGEWPQFGRPNREVAARTWGIVGFGRIGKQVAQRLQGWEMHVLYFDAFRPSAEEEAALGVEYSELDDLLARADIVSLHVPLLPDTRHLVDARRLGLMKPDAGLVNVARGGIVDEAALLETLRAGKLRGAALDVFEQEPLPAGHPFTELDNVILSPHTAGTVVEAQVRILKKTKANLNRVLTGEPLVDVVNGVA
jgi:phosphoglycerate dehydrogenase-like enzyme